MKLEKFELNIADELDFLFYYSIKNEKQSVYWSGFLLPPDKNKLLYHYNTIMKDENRDIYIFKEHNVNVGYLYLDKDYTNNTVEISYGISEKYTGRGLAKIMIQLGLERIEPLFKTQVAWIAESNIASMKTVMVLGFNATDEVDYRQLAQSPTPVKFIKYSR